MRPIAEATNSQVVKLADDGFPPARSEIDRRLKDGSMDDAELWELEAWWFDAEPDEKLRREFTGTVSAEVSPAGRRIPPPARKAAGKPPESH